uniref:Reverse transcriptase zinc-binding domain-containing protein n=1 Tax=Populus alba TaxID=43335 RepID=A0A4V6AB77_POPAL|nr:hypothetical protein D5086_0000065860 [Populus alba]
MILEFNTPEPHISSPFKFLNFWADRSDFLDLVRNAWQSQIHGNPMFILTSKLRIVKQLLRSMHKRESSNISNRVAVLKAQWQSAQLESDSSPGSTRLMAAERLLARQYNQICKDEEAFYKQRSRIQWLHLGDRNTKFFHRSLVHRTSRNRIHMLTDETVLLRGRCFWFYNSPSTASWTWRKILLSRSWCRGLFSPRIGNGLQTFLWLDYWLPNGKRICDSLTFRQLSTTDLPCDAKVSSIISEGGWNFPIGHPELQPIWNSIHFLPQPHQPDTCNWKGLPTGKFSIDSAWELLRDTRPINSIFHLIWFPDHIPRHAFILWIASMGRLHTKDRLLSFHVISSATCSLCGLQDETHEHLFFKCSYSNTVWSSLCRKSLLNWPNISWQGLLLWAATRLKNNKSFSHLLARQILSSTVYFVWYERNNRIFNQAFKSPQELIGEIFEAIRSVLLAKDQWKIPNNFQSIWRLQETETLQPAMQPPQPPV